MVRTCVDSALAELSYLEHLPLISQQYSPWAIQMVDDIQTCKLGLRFLRMIFWSILTLEDTTAEIKQVLLSCEAKWGKSRNQLVALYSLAKARVEYGNWVLDLHGRVEHCKQAFEESSEILLLQCSLRCSSFKMKLTLKFMDAILKNLKDLYKYKTDNEIALLKNQMGPLEKKLRLLHDLFCLIPKEWRGFNEIQEFKVVVHVFAHYSARLVFLNWVKPTDEVMATKLNLFLFNVMQKIKPCVPVFKGLYIRFLQEMKLRQLDPLLLGQIIQIFLDLLLENLVEILEDDFQILQESLMFVIAFLANPPAHHAKDEVLMMITAEIEVLVKEDLYLVLSFDDMKGCSSEANTRLSDFVRKVELVKAKIQQVYGQMRDSFSYNPPKTNGLGFLDFLLQNLGFLKDKLKRDRDFIPFAKHMIIRIEDELMSLRPYLNDLFEQQQEHKELKDTWLKVLNLAYQTEYAINSCLVIGNKLWYNMARLMEVLDEIKVVKSKIKKIEIRRTHDCSTVALCKAPVDPWASSFNEEMVGLKKEVDIIVEKLRYGSPSLDIVAIVGMAGLGKTTMAKKVYNAPEVRNHFHMFAYCIVSQVHNVRKILLDILGDFKGLDDKRYDMMEEHTGTDENMYDMEEEELADMLRKCLKGKRYLIIMDDIWDVKAWDEVKNSLPNDQNGSRIIFTTRIHNVPLQAKQDCYVHDLRLLSDEESWELLRKKAFRAGDCPQELLEVGKVIAKKCNGLPLTIVLVASLLSRTERSLTPWNKVSETIGSYVSTKVCTDVLELSYQHLPEHLKPCFLYFGAFAEDALIRVNKLMLLWIAEGFVHNSNRENLENLAKEYLSDLIDRSLVMPNERSSNGGIKNFRIHDLVHEFCQVKAQEENSFQLMDEYKAYDSSSSTIRNPYRVAVHTKGEYLSDCSKICPSIHSLLYSRKWGSHRHGKHVVSDLKLVQVMDLEEIEWDTCSIKEIASLVNLRFIATSFHLISRTIFPSFISNLWNLEILILTGSRRCRLELPGTIWTMTRLKHVDVGLCYVSNSGVKKREACPEMVNLESFSSPTICSTKDLEDLLQRSPSLRKLSFHYAYPEEVEIENWFRNDFYIPKQGPVGILERLKDFQFSKLNSISKLESLKVSSTRKLSLPSFNFLSNLKKLTLSGGYLPWMHLPTISKMPCLEVLKLLDNAFVGLEWDMEEVVFPKLKFIKLQRLHLDEWIVFSYSFPHLEVLIVNKCYGLAIPTCFGEIPTLKRIEVYESFKAAASVVELQGAQEELGNEELQVIVYDPQLG